MSMNFWSRIGKSFRNDCQSTFFIGCAGLVFVVTMPKLPLEVVAFNDYFVGADAFVGGWTKDRAGL